jgi:hypothetical protein
MNGIRVSIFAAGLFSLTAFVAEDKPKTDWDEYELNGRVKSVEFRYSLAGGSEGYEVRISREEPNTKIYFDENGFVNLSETFYTDSKKNTRTFFTHSGGKLASSVEKNPEGAEIKKETFLYAEDGYIASKTTFYPEKNITRYETWSEIDSVTTSIIWFENYERDTNHYVQIKIEHAASGVHEFVRKTYASDQPFQYMERIVDSKDRMISYSEFNDKKILTKKETYKYDTDGNVVIKKEYEGEKLIKSDSSLYNEQHQIIEQYATFLSGDEYRVNHQLFKYKYDSHGNWTSKIEYNVYGDSTTVRIVHDPAIWEERIIEYY